MAFPVGSSFSAVTIDNTKVSGSANLTDFPVLILGSNIPSSVYSAMQGDGDDIRFTTDEAGTTEIAFEIVSLDAGAETGEIWVKIPTLDYNDDTVIYIWYGDASLSAYATTDTYGAENVWSGFQAVSHLEADTTDSKGAFDGTNNSVTFASGKIGDDGVFSSAYVEYSNTLKRIGNTNCAISLWFKTSSSAQQFLYGEGNTANANSLLQFYISGGVVNFGVRNDAGSSGAITATQSGLDDGAWHHAYFTKGTTDYKTYVDGATNGSATITQVPTINRSAFATLPRSSEGIFLAGSAGEFRFKDDIPTDAWIVTEFNNQGTPSTFLTIAEAVATGNKGSLSLLGVGF